MGQSKTDTPQRMAEPDVNEGVVELRFPPPGRLLTPVFPTPTNARTFVIRHRPGRARLPQPACLVRREPLPAAQRRLGRPAGPRPAAVAHDVRDVRDVRDGKVSRLAAERDHGVALSDGPDPSPDPRATRTRRDAPRPAPFFDRGPGYARLAGAPNPDVDFLPDPRSR